MIFPSWASISLLIIAVEGALTQKSCDPRHLDRPIPHPKEPSAYLQCLHDGTLEKYLCPHLYRVQKIFDPLQMSCVAAAGAGGRQKRQLPSSSGSQTVGQFCSFNTDCTQGGYCQNGQCACWSTHTNINSYCWRKINPDESGCQYDTQCSSIWPGAYCNSAGICRCPFARPPATTRDGPVCFVPGECPTNSQYPKLRDPGTEVISTCQTTTVAPYFLIGCSIWFDVYDCFQNEYCCPARALTCIQQMDEGTTSPGTSTSTRWFYNSISQSCLTFTFLGAEGNSNNFLSQEQCESYCKNQCERGAPEYDTTTALGSNGSRIRYCSTNGGISSSTCGANFQCDRVQSLQICCPRPTFVCGIYGGVARSTVPAQPFSSGTTRGTNNPVTRWYWDTTRGQCTTFSYGGYGGNFNNFISQSDCDSYCSKSLCTQGEPLKDNSGLTNFGCSSSSACPTTHTCTNRDYTQISVCCPTVQTVCNQPQAIGASCNSPTTRYWFNAQTGVCEQFQYNGCQGNANNFEDSITCNEYCAQIAAEPKCVQGKALKDGNNNFYQCALTTGATGGTGVIQNCPSGYECYFDGSLYGCCPTQTFTCQRPQDSGTACNPSTSTRWYFDVTTVTCKSFQYFGCDGNSNNFATQRDCQDYCGAGGCPDGGIAYRELGGQTRVCSGTNACPTTHTCQPVTLTQTGTTISSQTSFCCPRKGSPINYSTRYFYNPNTRTCEIFTYFGCEGNANNFPTMQACLNFCNSAACDTGELAYLDPVTSNIQICSIGVINSCPSGYSCTFDTLGGQNVCCGAGDLGVCPNGQRSFIDAITGSARQCTPNLVGNCPGNYLCVYNPSRRLYYCCGSRGSTVCPNSAQAYTDPTTNQPRACTLNAVNVCPGGFSCQSTVASGTLYGYCCSGNVGNSVCGIGGVYTTNGQPVRCTGINQFNIPNQCPNPYTCRLSSSGDGFFYCCSDTATNVCPNNGGTYLVNNRPQQCSITNTINGCPSSFSCTISANGNGLYYCCSGSQFSAYCGDATPFLIGGRTPQQCYPGTGATCPANYVCELSTALNTYYCCTGTGCPSGYEAYLVGNNVVQYCTPGIANACPTGYNCLLSTATARNQCCRLRQTTTGCLNGAQAYINPATGQPQVCVANQINSCTAGYTCQLGVSNQYVCCQGGGVNTGTCPNGQRTYISPSTGQSQSCVLNQINTCPVGYTCQLGTIAGRYLCCQSSANIGSCPVGQTTYISPTSGQAQTCQLGGFNTCPATYSCLLGTGGQYLCCGGNNANQGRCLNGLTTYISPATGLAQTCQAGFNTCPVGNTCQRGTGNQFICCATVQTPAARCPNGVSTPYISPQTNRLTVCNGNGNALSSGCPSGYICVQGSTQQFMCCPGTTTSCPSGTTAYINPGTRLAQICSVGIAASCPTGYSCRQAGTQAICCTAGAQQNSVCPAGRTPYVNAITRQAQTCRPGVGFTGCLPGYSCALGLTNAYYCCSGGGTTTTTSNSGCPNGAQTFNQPRTNSPLVCSFSGSNRCPGGYSCQYSLVYFQYICCQSRGFTSARSKKKNETDFVAADTPDKTIDCDENHVPSKDEEKCLQRLIPGERNCTESVQCKDFGYCENHRCKCSGDNPIVLDTICVETCPELTHENVNGFCEEKKT